MMIGWLLEYHDDVIKWKHFPRYCPFVRRIYPSPVNSQWRRASMFSLICAWTNSRANNGGPGDLRHHRSHYDIIVMTQGGPIYFCLLLSLFNIHLGAMLNVQFQKHGYRFDCAASCEVNFQFSQNNSLCLLTDLICMEFLSFYLSCQRELWISFISLKMAYVNILKPEHTVDCWYMTDLIRNGQYFVWGQWYVGNAHDLNVICKALWGNFK